MLATVIDSRIATLSKLLDQDGVLDEQQREALETFIQVVRNTPVAKVKKAAMRFANRKGSEASTGPLQSSQLLSSPHVRGHAGSRSR